MDGFEEDEEEEIYNQERQNSAAAIHKNQVPPTKKTEKLDKVFEQQNKKMEESINLTSSIQNQHPSSATQAPPGSLSLPDGENQPELQQLKEMIKEYKEEFV